MNDSKLKDALRSYYAADAASPNASARKRTLLLVEAEAARACGGTREADYIPLAVRREPGSVRASLGMDAPDRASGMHARSRR